jgi:hypothetical protein
VVSWLWLLKSIVLTSPNTATNNLVLKSNPHHKITVVEKAEAPLKHIDEEKVREQYGEEITETDPDLVAEHDMRQQFSPPSLAEIEKNITLYLQTLHSRLGAIAGVTPLIDCCAILQNIVRLTIFYINAIS